MIIWLLWMWWEDAILRPSAHIFLIFSFSTLLIFMLMCPTGRFNCYNFKGDLLSLHWFLREGNPLVFLSSELLGLEGAPAWVRSRWSSVGLLHVKWMIWYILMEKNIKKEKCVCHRWRLCSGWIWLQLGWLPGGDWSPVSAPSRLQTRGWRPQTHSCHLQ